MTTEVSQRYVSKSIEQKTLDALERIEKLLERALDILTPSAFQGDISDVIQEITPTETPLMKAAKQERQGGRRGR